MTDAVKVGFVSFSAAPSGILTVFCDDGLEFGPSTRKVLGAAAGLIKQAAETNQFKGKNGSVLDILAPQGLKAKRLIVVGTGKPSELKEQDFLKLGGTIAGKLKAGREAVGVIAELPKGPMTADQAAGSRFGHSAARLYVRSLQDQEKGRRGHKVAGRRIDRRRRCRRCAKGVCAERACGGWRHHRPRPRQRAAERAVSGRIRAPRRSAAQAWRCRGRPRRQRHEAARHGRAARRGPGLDATRPHRDHALERRQTRRTAGGLHR